MSRPYSVARMTGKYTRDSKWEGKPRPGSKLRIMYDRLLAGETLVEVRDLYPGTTWAAARRQLIDFYGLELIGTPIRNGGVKCVGLWDGPYFVPIDQIVAQSMTCD